jgi:hypothetical protein
VSNTAFVLESETDEFGHVTTIASELGMHLSTDQ